MTTTAVANSGKRVSLNAIFTDQRKSAADEKKELRAAHKAERSEMKDRQKGELLDLVESQKSQVQRLIDAVKEIASKTDKVAKIDSSTKSFPVSGNKLTNKKK